jgi:aspartyl-tRNA(Asn)/glutamyl-tRNA(Gln) amidotransferase subunit A
MTAFWQKTILELSQDLTEGTTTSIDLTWAFLTRIDKLNPVLNAVVTWNNTALGQAAESDARRKAGHAAGPLDGIPLAIKDNILTRDIRTTWGSPVYGDFVPGVDETPVERLKSAGMVVLGKTNVPEFTLEGFTDNPLFGPTRNPWSPDKTPGGSSGGSVAGVSAGLFPASIGTDGGGSIRRPCGYTGLFGIKPTIGRLARAATLPQILFDMEVVGPITRDVTGAALLFEAMEGPDAKDPRSDLPAEPGRDKSLDDAPHNLRILYVERFGDAPLDPVIATSSREIVSRLERLGHSVCRSEMPLDLSQLNENWTMIGQAGLGYVANSLGAFFSNASAKYQEMAHRSSLAGSDLLFSIFDRIARLREEAAQVFQDIDIIMTPTSAAMPWPIGTDYPPFIDGSPVGPRGHAIYTGWVNAIGHPAVNLPAPRAPDGMPIGVQMVGGHNRDWLLLRLSKQYEHAYPWHDYRPDHFRSPMI